MPPTIAYRLRHICVVMALTLAAANAAETAPVLIGASRDQVIRQLGDPKSQIAAGNRVVMFFARERVVLRDGVVVEVERIAAEPVRRTAPPPAPAPATPAPAAGEQAAVIAPSPAAGPAPAAPGVPPPVVPPAASSAPQAAAGAPPVPASPAGTQPAPSGPAPTPVAESVPPPTPHPEPKLEIKQVRPPVPGAARPQPRPARSESIPLRAAVAEPPKTIPPPPVQVAVPAPPVARPEPPVSPKDTEVVSRTPVPPPPVAAVVARPESRPDPLQAARQEVAEDKAAREATDKPDEAVSSTAAKKKSKGGTLARRRLDAAAIDAELDRQSGVFSTQSYVFAFLVGGLGIGYLIWRARQRRLEMEATAVSRTPFAAPPDVADSAGARFSIEALAKLEPKRFEEVVEVYYCKTGVVAVRTKGSSGAAAQIKISWKGEPRPFALVRCLPQTSELIEVKPLQELFTQLAAEDIRRGYVVTTGKFSVAARDYAEEKHLTLLSGDILLEKLNALPGDARTELMQVASFGNRVAPACPACQAKMTLTAGSPPVWRCAAHPDVTLPVAEE